jgi:O-antigen ligase
LITAGDMAPNLAPRLAAAAASPVYAPLPPAAQKKPSKHLDAPGLVATLAATPPFRERLLLVVLYLAILGSSIAFIEPSPNDAMMAVLAVVCLICGVRFERSFTLPLALLLVWNVAGLIALINSYDAVKSVQATVTAFYMAIAAMIFTSIYAENTLARINVTRAAYIPTATVVAFCGVAGYLHLFPGADIFAPFGRALGAFKDPNVFGPFLIWPTLVVIERMMTKRISLIDLVVTGTLLFGLLLSFSRGAWFHFAVSCAIMLAFSMMVASTSALRLRIVTLTAAGVVLLAILLLILLSIPSIGGFFFERAQLLQQYDVGQGGRFVLQQKALVHILEFPFGMGPEEFGRIYTLQPHNVYLQVFMVSGWIGGLSYILLLLSTLWIGLRSIFVRTPWQTYTIITFAVFFGEIAEGFVIDSDHWRHFYLLLGMMWGLAAASFKYAKAARPA